MAEKNTPTQIKNFFGEGTRTVTMQEYQEFWKSLTEEEKEYFRNADLS